MNDQLMKTPNKKLTKLTSMDMRGNRRRHLDRASGRFRRRPDLDRPFHRRRSAGRVLDFSGNENVPPFPGEDFLANAPDGLTFPLDLSGGAAVISIEPADDNSPAPIALKPLVGEIPADAEAFTNYDLGAGPRRSASETLGLDYATMAA